MMIYHWRRRLMSKNIFTLGCRDKKMNLSKDHIKTKNVWTHGRNRHTTASDAFSNHYLDPRQKNWTWYWFIGFQQENWKNMLLLLINRGSTKNMTKQINMPTPSDRFSNNLSRIQRKDFKNMLLIKWVSAKYKIKQNKGLSHS